MEFLGKNLDYGSNKQNISFSVATVALTFHISLSHQ